MLVECNNCKRDFETNIKIEEHENNVEEVYFDCPYCNERYLAYYTNRSIRDKQKDVKEEQKKLGSKSKIERMRADIEQDINNLKVKMEGTQ